MSEWRYQEERALRENFRSEMEKEKKVEDERNLEKISKAEEKEKTKSNNGTIFKTFDKIHKQTRRLKNDIERWSEKKFNELGNEVEVGLLRARELLGEVDAAKNLEKEMSPFIDETSNRYFAKIKDAEDEIEKFKEKLESLKTDKPLIETPDPDNIGEAFAEEEKTATECQAKPKPQRGPKDRKKTKQRLRCRTCHECKGWCGTSSRDASEWCFPCLYRKKEGKAGKTACKLRNVCINPDTSENKEDNSDDELEEEEDEFLDQSILAFRNTLEEQENSANTNLKRKEMEGTPPEKSQAQRTKDELSCDK